MNRILSAIGAAILLCSTALADYAADRRDALGLVAAKKDEAALAAFLQLGEAAQNDYQRSDAFEQAAMCALRLKRADDALQLAAQIPHLPRARTVRMRLMAENGLWPAIRDEFKQDDFAAWPRSVAGEAFYLRGKAFLQAKDLESARQDLAQAARRSTRAEVFFDLAGVCVALKRDVEAMDAYLTVLRALPDRGGWMFYTAVTARAAILLRNGKYDYALEELEKADGVTGYWLVQCLKLRGAGLAALGRTAEAAAVYRQALTTEGIYPVQRNEIETELRRLASAEEKEE